jgi:hypothetical protein
MLSLFDTAVHHQVIEISFLVGMLTHGLEFPGKTTTIVLQIRNNARCKNLKTIWAFSCTHFPTEHQPCINPTAC